MRVAPLLVAVALLAPALAAHAAVEEFEVTMRGPLRAEAAAVGALPDGRLVGTLADVYTTVAAAPEGRGGSVFLETRPLMQLDMQGSARVAVRVAAGLAGEDQDQYDVFFTIRSKSSVIGGPSAGALLAVSALAGMAGHELKDDVVLTGAVLPDGSIALVGGIPQKAEAAANDGKRLFLYPAGQEFIPLGDGAVLDLNNYCLEELSITCRSVGTVEEAYAYMTGFSITRDPLGDSITGDRSTEVLRDAAETLLADAKAVHAEAVATLANTTVPAAYETQVAAMNATASDRLATADAAFAEEHYYTTASKSFQAAIQARALLEHARWFAEGLDDGHVEDVVAASNDTVGAAALAAEAATASTVSELQAVAAAQTRARDAQRLVAAAEAAEDPSQALALAAQAVERAGTVHWWIDMGARFREGPAVDQGHLRDAAEQAVESATDSIAYTRAILEAAGGTMPPVDADNLLARARDEFDRGFYASALFTATEADIRAAVLFAAGTGSVSEGVLDRARERAESAVAASRAEGVEPILAVSYLEFAGDLRNETPPSLTEAYVFYSLARTAGRLPDVLSAQGTTGATRFAPFVDDTPRLTVPLTWMPGYFALGIVVGAVAAVAVLGPTRRWLLFR